MIYKEGDLVSVKDEAMTDPANDRYQQGGYLWVVVMTVHPMNGQLRYRCKSLANSMLGTWFPDELTNLKETNDGESG